MREGVVVVGGCVELQSIAVIRECSAVGRPKNIVVNNQLCKTALGKRLELM